MNDKTEDFIETLKDALRDSEIFYYKIELTTKLRHPDQKTLYISNLAFDAYGTPLFSTTDNIKNGFLFTPAEAYLARRLLEVSPLTDWKACNYAVVDA
jgi:hypothetical protein